MHKAMTTQVYLILGTEFNEDTGLLVPHDNNSRFDSHHHVKTQLAYLSWEHCVAPFYHSDLLILK